MKIHDEIEDWMAAALCGALSPDEQKNFERHLAECPHCRSLYEEDRKMNDILKQTLPELRPDQNFERRVIAGFREKISHGGFHPLRTLAWLVQFRTVQAAMAMLLLAAMIKIGSMITGEGFPAGKAHVSQANTRKLADEAVNLVMGETRQAASASTYPFTHNALDLNGNSATIGALASNSQAANPQYWAQVFSGHATWNGLRSGANTNWTTNSNWGDTNAASLGGQGAPGANGNSSIGDTAMFTGGLAASNTGTLDVVANRVVTVSGTGSILDSGVAGTAFNTNQGANVNTVLGANATISSLNFTGTNGTAMALGAGGLVNSAAGHTMTNGTLALSGANTYSGATTVNGGGLIVNGSLDANHATTLSFTGADNQYTRMTVAGGGFTTGAGAGANTINSNVTLGGNQTWALQAAPSAPLPVSGNISGAGLTMAGAGTQVLSGSRSYLNREVFTGSNSYSGSITNGSGTLRVTNSNGLGFGAQSFGVTVTDGNALSKDANGISIAGGNRAATPYDTVNEMAGKTGGTTGDWDNGPLAANTIVTTSGSASTGVQAVQSAPPLVDTRKLIRNANVEFEVGSYDTALNTITAFAVQAQGYVFTQNSQRGQNGKLQGIVVVKVLPAYVDRFLLALRVIGDMKNQTVSADDVTKDYFDTESRIRNSEISEQRLIDMLKKRTGDVADLLEVEKEIARVRGETEQMQGQIRYYDALVQYATVTITLEEKDLTQTAAYLLKENANLSVFAKDVEKAFAEAKDDAESAKAQTLESHIERDPNGREIATLHLLIPPESSDEAIIKLKAIGRIQNFNSQTQSVARDGTANSNNAKVDRDKVELNLVIQRDVEMAVQGTNISIQTDDVEHKTAVIKQAAAVAGIEVKGAEFNRAQNGVEVSGMLLRMPIKKYAAFIEQIKALGNVKDFTVSRREDATATEDAPAEVLLQIYSQGNIVAADSPVRSTFRSTIGEGIEGLMWSARMIGVTLGYAVPWAVIAGLVWFLVARRRRLAQK